MPAEPAAVRRSGAGWKVALRLGLSALFLVILFTRVPDLARAAPSRHAPARDGAAAAALPSSRRASASSSRPGAGSRCSALFDAHVPLPTLTRHYFAGQFVSNVMPSTVGGDVVRVARCAKNVDSTSVAFGSVVLERLSGMIALPLLVIVGFALKPSLLHIEHAWLALFTAAATLGVLVLIVIAAGHPGLAGRFASNENWTRFIGAVFHRCRPRPPRHGPGRRRARDRDPVSDLDRRCVRRRSSARSMSTFRSRRRSRSFPRCRCCRSSRSRSADLGVREGALVWFRYGLGISPGAAATAGLLWYASLFVVSLIGAPMFAIGQRNAASSGADGNRRRHRHRPTVTETNTTQKPMMKGGRRLRDGHVLYWWVEVLAILGFYLVYSAIRNANGSHPLRRVHPRQGHHLARAPPRHLPRGDDPELGVALQTAHHHGELPLRVAALRRDDRCRHLAVPQVQRRLSALPQHPRGHDRARPDRVLALPA